MKGIPLVLSTAESRMPILGATTPPPASCRTCDSELTHIFAIALDSHPNPVIQELGGMINVYQCTNDPGMCEDWDAHAGGNYSVYSAGGKSILDCDPSGLLADTGREVSSKDELIAILESDSNVVGALADAALWIQADETPQCSCGALMSFVGQVEECANSRFNFGGGGCSYVFLCKDCKESRFLWQC